MYLRAGSPSAVPVGELVPDCPNAYAYGVTFNAMTRGSVDPLPSAAIST